MGNWEYRGSHQFGRLSEEDTAELKNLVQKVGDSAYEQGLKQGAENNQRLHRIAEVLHKRGFCPDAGDLCADRNITCDKCIYVWLSNL